MFKSICTWYTTVWRAGCIPFNRRNTISALWNWEYAKHNHRQSLRHCLFLKIKYRVYSTKFFLISVSRHDFFSLYFSSCYLNRLQETVQLFSIMHPSNRCGLNPKDHTWQIVSNESVERRIILKSILVKWRVKKMMKLNWIKVGSNKVHSLSRGDCSWTSQNILYYSHCLPLRNLVSYLECEKFTLIICCSFV